METPISSIYKQVYYNVTLHFIIALDYALRKIINQILELGFTLHKAKGRWSPAEAIIDVDYADDLALFADDNSFDAATSFYTLGLSLEE